MIDPSSDISIVYPRLIGDITRLIPSPVIYDAFEGVARKTYGQTRKLVQLKDDWGITKRVPIRIVVADIREDFILGRPWFRDADPCISWKHDQWMYPLERQNILVASTPRQARKYAKEARLIISLMKEKPKEEEGEQQTEATFPPEYSDFADVFAEEEAAKLPSLGGRTHDIEIEEGKTPPWGPIYNLAEKELQVLRQYIDDGLTKGWIRRSVSPAGAPVLFVPKKGGKLRLCVDYRGLNRVTRRNRAPIPLVNQILDQLGQAGIFTKLDLKDAYHRLRIREGDEWKTAFRCRYGHFKYLVIPFSLTNTPATFQKYINDILHDLVDHICIVYLDDILIYSRDVADHSQHVRQVLEKLREASLFANLKKCTFSTRTVSFLGFIITPQGVQMERERVEAVADWPPPTTVKEIQSFLGFAGFYRRFIKNYSKITVPLSDKTKGDNKSTFQLDSRELDAFKTLKAKFLEAPILMHFDPTLPIRVETDASDFAIGAVLSQKKQDRWYPIAYLSKKLTGAELNYPTPDAEMLAITESFQVWRHYLAYTNHEIVVVTDHLNHTYLADKPKLSTRQI